MKLITCNCLSELSLAYCTGYLAALGICISGMSTLSWSKSLQSGWVRLACNVTKILRSYTTWYRSPSIHLKENLISCCQLEGHIECLASVAKFEWHTRVCRLVSTVMARGCIWCSTESKLLALFVTKVKLSSIFQLTSARQRWAAKPSKLPRMRCQVS